MPGLAPAINASALVHCGGGRGGRGGGEGGEGGGGEGGGGGGGEGGGGRGGGSGERGNSGWCNNRLYVVLKNKIVCTYFLRGFMYYVGEDKKLSVVAHFCRDTP